MNINSFSVSDDLLGEIFGHCESKDIINLKQVCQRWKNLLDKIPYPLLTIAKKNLNDCKIDKDSLYSAIRYDKFSNVVSLEMEEKEIATLDFNSKGVLIGVHKYPCIFCSLFGDEHFGFIKFLSADLGIRFITNPKDNQKPFFIKKIKFHQEEKFKGPRLLVKKILKLMKQQLNQEKTNTHVVNIVTKLAMKLVT